MATRPVAGEASTAPSDARAFERFAGLCAVLAGVAGFLYAVAFLIIQRSAPGLGGLLSAIFLLRASPCSSSPG